jgi:predicted DNA-binding protein with PD1-like motif
LVIEVKPGEEVTASVTRQLKERGIARGAIVSVVGAVDSCAVSNMPRNDALSDIVTEFSQPMEMSGTGEVKDGVPHIHCVVSGEGNAAIAGHFHWGRVENWFVNVYVTPVE